jgi:PTH1 family peptidyl-tRNA hydrolase
MYLLAGLGNPGDSYKFNRHNIGFMIIDKICNYNNFVTDKDKFKSKVFKGTIANEKTIAIKPMTFMNLSGEAVSQFANFYKIKPENIVIIYDELDIEVGRIKLNIGGSAAGHNGIKSINSLIENNYVKLRIGISHPGHKDDVSDYVLSDFTDEEMKKIEMIGEIIAKNFSILITEGRENFLNNVALDFKENGI